MSRPLFARIVTLCAFLLHGVLLEGCYTFQPVNNLQLADAARSTSRVQLRLVDGARIVAPSGNVIMDSMPNAGVFGTGTIASRVERSTHDQFPWSGFISQSAIDSENTFTQMLPYHTQWGEDTLAANRTTQFFRKDDSVVTLAEEKCVRVHSGDEPGVLIAGKKPEHDYELPFVGLVPFSNIVEYDVSQYSSSGTITLVSIGVIIGGLVVLGIGMSGMSDLSGLNIK